MTRMKRVWKRDYVPYSLPLENQPATCYHPRMDTQTTTPNQPRQPVYTYEAAINHRGALVIPQELRKRMGIQSQDRVRFQVYADAVEIESVKPLTLEEAFGSVKPLQAGRDLKDVIQEAKEEHYQGRFTRKHRP